MGRCGFRWKFDRILVWESMEVKELMGVNGI
jgi:hypothetical protein